MGFKWLNFFYQAARKVTGVKDFTNYQKIQAANGMRIREAIRKYVEQRKSGERQSKVPDGVDLLSLFMQNSEVFTDELIIDEMLDFFSAATLTTQFATETVMSHCT